MNRHEKRKHYGQHFLHDQRVISRILAETEHQIKETKCSSLLEIGPGKGALTIGLIELARKYSLPLTLVEKDSELVAEWKKKVSSSPVKLEVIELDAAHYQPTDLRDTVVISNLPYASGTPICTNLCQYENMRSLILMFQKEVAERINAKPDTSDFGSLTISIQNRYHVNKLMNVTQNCFTPPPKVMSTVLTLTRLQRPFLTETFEEQEILEKFAKACFLHRRKMLRSALPKDSMWLHAVHSAGVSDTKRAEALAWEEWRAILKCIKTEKTKPHTS